MGFGMMSLSADIVGEQILSPGSKIFANSSLNIYNFFFDTQLFVLFLLPVFIGGAIYRDFQSNTFQLMYSFPIQKHSYLAAKFISGSLIVCIILLILTFGLFLGTIAPGINPSLVGPNSFSHYISPLLSIAIPNLIWMGIIVFSVVALSRSIHAGFITAILLFVVRRAILFVFSGPENMDTITFLDPFGGAAVMISTGSWPVAEINSTMVPISNSLVTNRMIWTVIALVIGGVSYLGFDLNHSAKEFRFFSLKRNSDKKTGKNYPASWTIYSIFPVWLQSAFEISGFHFRSIAKSKTFVVLIIVSLLFMILLLGQVNPEYTTRIYPLTQVMLLLPSLFFSFIIMVITFLYAGFLTHKDRRTKMAALVDSSSVSSASLLLSRFFTLLKLQTVLLSLIIFGGISVQIWKGYFHFELQQYLFQVYGLLFIGQIIWAMASLFVYSIIPNQYVGFFALILLSFGLSGIESIGIDKGIYIFNGGVIPQYSDLSGYDSFIRSFLAHKLYWALFGIFLLLISYLLTHRGLVFSLKERLSITRKRVTNRFALYFAIVALVFTSIGATISTYIYPQEESIAALDSDQRKIEAQERIGHLKHIEQPRLSGISLSLDIYPDQRSFTGTGSLLLTNKASEPIDTLMLSYPKGVSITDLPYNSFRNFDSDTVLQYDVLVFNEALQPGESIEVSFKIGESPRNWFSEDGKVLSNGTFFLADFPTIGYPDIGTSKERLTPDNPLASKNSYVGNHIDLMDTEITVSTSPDQIALAPGKLIEEWKKNGRSFYRYKSEKSIRNGIPIQSGRFEVYEDSIQGIDLKIFHHPTHTFNLDRMMNAMKATVNYGLTHFGDYPFDELRIVEFSKSYGSFAQSFAQTLPYSEFAGFFSKQDNSENRFDDVFRLTAHEVAHQWWGHQIIPADALGSRLLTESFAEFTAVQVLEEEYGLEKKQLYLDLIRNRYFNQRGRLSRESPLVTASADETLITYSKGLLALQSLNDHLAPGAFSGIVQNFFQEFARNDSSYPTSYDFVHHLEREVPDSLGYLITDLFEQVTLYESSIDEYQIQELGNNTFEVQIDVLFEKFRNQIPGMETTPLPLDDFLEIEIHDSNGAIIGSKKLRLSSTETTVPLIVEGKPAKIVVDPHRKLIEQNYSNNTIIIGEQ